MFLQNCLDVKNEVFEKKAAFFVFVFYVGDRETEKKKQNGKRPQNPIEIVFLKVVIQKWEKWKHGFLAKLAWHYLCQEGEKSAFSCTPSVLAQKNVGPKQWKPGKTIKIVVSAEIVQNLKWHLFLKKVFFDMGEKVGFTNCVFEKRCASENTIFIVFSGKHSSCNEKAVCWKNRNYEKKWVVLNMAKWCFLVCFWGFNGFVVCFLVCLVKLQK